MSILTVCPNVNLPEWKALVEKVGTTQAYKEYLKNQQEVPTFEQVELIEPESEVSFSLIQDKPFILPGFDDYAQQLEAVNTISATVIYDMENTPINVYYERRDIEDVNKKKETRITEEQYNNLQQNESKNKFVRREKSLRFDEATQAYKKELEDYKDNPDIQVILNNFDALVEIAKDKLQKVGLLKKKRIFEDDAEEIIEDNNDIKADYTYRKDDWVFNFDQKANAQRELKKFLYFTPVTIYKDGMHQNVYSYLGEGNYKYMSYDEVFEQLHAILSGTDVINTWESMENKMKEYEIAKPWIKQIFNTIEEHKRKGKDVELLKRQFVVAMSSSYTNYHTMLWKNSSFWDGDKVVRLDDRYDFRFIKTDRDGIINTIIAEWTTNFRTLKALEVDGETIKLDKAYIDGVIEKFKSLEKNRSAFNIKEALKLIGVEIQDNTIEDIIAGKLNNLPYATQFSSKSGLFKLIIDRLNGLGVTNEEVEDNFDKFNPLVSNSAIRKLAALDSKYRPLVYSNSLRNSNGDTVYSYTMNKFLTTEYKKLMNDPEYAKQQLAISFNNPIIADNNNPIYQSWLYQIANKPDEFNFDFELDPFESLKQQDGNQDNQQLKQLEETSLEAARVNLVLNGQNIRENKSRLIRYLFVVPDKTAGYTIKGTALKPDISFLNNGDYLIRKSNLDALYQIFASEHNRIISSQNKSYDNDYQSGSKLFYFFPQFNTDKNLRTDSGVIKNPTDKVGDQTVEEYIKDQLTTLIKTDVTNQIKKWNDVKLIDGNNIYIDNGYLTSKEVKGLKEENKITYAAYDYILNSMLAKYNFHQVFAGDPALYYSAKKNTIPLVWDEISKRLAGLIAPGKDLYLENENEDFIHITLADNKRASNSFAEYVELLGKEEADPYKKIDTTDAHEVTTFRERLKVMYNSGEAGMTTELYNELLTRYNKDRDNFRLKKKELELFNGGAEKPVYFGKRLVKDDDVSYNDYVKSSAEPLLPQFTKGLEIDKLRKAMEALEDKNPGKTVRVAYKTGVKLGGTKPINIWKDDNSIVDDLQFKDTDYIYLKRSNFRIQQELPYDENKQEVIKGSQPTKLLFDSLLSLKGVDDDFFNKKYNEYINLHEQLFKDSYNQLATKILNDETKQVDIVKLSKILKEEAESRDYNFSEIEFLELTKGQDEFITALWANPSANKFESLITSLYSNGIVRQKMHGRSFVLMPEEGMKGYSEDVVYTADYTGELKQDEVLIPWNYKDSIKNYINKETGRIEISNLDPDILKLFGFRIPNQGHNSMTSIKVAGFLPEYMRDTIVASRDLVVQMGLDFDVDKLYVYDYYTEVIKKNNEKNKIVKKENNIKNKILDIHKDIINHPTVNRLLRQPLGNIANDETVKELKKIKERKIANYLNPNYDSDKYLESVDGKAMVGVTSLQNTFNSLLNQQEDIYLKHQVDGKYVRKIFYINYKGVDHKLNAENDLVNPLDLNGVPKNVGIRNTQSGAVDNSKDPVLSYINLNLTTSPVYNIMSVLRIPNDYIQKYLPQPSLIEYVKLVKYGRSTFNDEYKSNNEILTDLLTKYGKKIAEKIDLQELNDKIDQGKITLTEEALIYGYTPKSKDTKVPVIQGDNNNDIVPYLIQYIVLYNFKQYKTYGEFIDKVKASINLDTSGVGKSFIVVNDKVERYYNNVIEDNEYVENINKLVQGTVAQHQIENSLLKAQEHFSNLLPYNKKTFEIITSSYQNITMKDNINEDDKYKLWSAYKSFLFSKFYPNIEAERKRLMYANKQETSFAQRTLKLQAHSKYKNNPFIQRIKVDNKIDITGRKPSLVFYNASKEEMIDEYDVLIGYRELFDDPMTKAWAQDSVTYFFINGGIQQAKEWGKYIPAAYLEKIGFSKFTRDVEFNNEALIGYQEGNLVNDFIVQYFQHNPFTLKQLKSSSVFPKNGIVSLPAIDASNAPDNLKDSSGVFYTPMFRIKDRVYLLNRVDNKYYIQPELGDSFYKEYDGNLKVKVAATEPTSVTSNSISIEISSNSKGIGAALTNPTEISKLKGNIAQSYPVTYEGTVYKDAEAAYQKLKDKNETKTKPSIDDSKNYELMVDIIATKLSQYPRLVDEITRLGGSDWILKSTHQPTNKNTVWETGGQNWFIKALNDAYLISNKETVTVPFTGNNQPKGSEPQVIPSSGKYNSLVRPKLIDTLNIILNKSQNKNRIFIAKLLIDSGMLDNVELKTATEDTAWIGKADSALPNEIWLNINKIQHNDHAVSVILEEATHNLTHKILSKNGTNLNSESVRAIRQVYETIISKVQTGNMKGFDPVIYNQMLEILKTIRENSNKPLSPENSKFMSQYQDYYRLLTFDEFIFGLLNDANFQAKLNDNKWDGNKSFLDRLRDLVIEILTDFYNTIGIKVNKDSAFDVAMNSLFQSFHEQSIAIKDQQSNYNKDSHEIYSIGDAKVKEVKEKVSRLLDDYDIRLKQIQSNITKALTERDRDRVALLNKRKEELEDEVTQLKDQASISIIKEISKNDFDNIELLLKKDSISLQDLEYMNTTLAMWSKIDRPDYLLTTDKEIAQQTDKAKIIEEIATEARKIKRRLLIIEREYALKEAKEITSGNIENKDLKVFSDVSGASSWFLDLSKSGQKFISVLAKAMQSAVALAKLEGGKIQVKITNLVNDLKKSPLFESQGYDALIDTDEKGNKTNELIKYETYEYWKKRNEYIQAIKDAPKDLKEEATKKFFDWIKKNHYVTDIRKIFKRNENGTYKYEPDQEYLDKIRKREGDNFNNFLQEQKTKIEQYNTELKSVIKTNTNGTDVNHSYIERWIKINDPLVYINHLVNGYKTMTHNGKFITNRGYNFINIRAKEEWRNEKYQELQKPENKELKEFYDYYIKTMNDLITFLPSYMKESDGYKIHSATIAGIHKDLLDTIIQNGSKTAFNDVRDKLVNAFTEPSADDDGKKLIDIETGKELLRLKPKYLNQISTDKMSYDLGKVLNIFANEVLLFKHKSNTEDFIRIGRRIVEQAEAVTRDSEGNLVKSGNFIKKTKELENVTKQLEATIKSWYGVGRDDKKGGSFKVSWLTGEDKEQYEKELKSLQEDKEYLEKTTDEGKRKMEDKLKEKYSRYFSFTNSIDTLLKYVQLKGMGWNPFSGITNYLFGEISNITYAAGRTDFTEQELNKARLLVLQDRKKVESLMIKYNVLKDIIDAHYKKQTDNNVLGKGLEWFSPFQLHKLGEYQVQGEILVSMMLHNKITVGGKEIPLYEAYDDNGNFKHEDTAWEGDVNNKQHNRKWLNFKLKVDQIISKVHGNYNPDAPIRAKRIVFGRALMQFRSWIPEGIESRYGQRRYDEFLDRDVEGRYRTAGRILEEYGKLTTFNLLTNPKIFFGDDTVFDVLKITDPKELALVKENMRRNLKELYIKLSMTALALIIAGFDDDDEVRRKARNLALNTIYRMGDDIEFYSSPIAMENITRNIIPASGLVVDGAKFIDALYEIDDDYSVDFLPVSESGRRAGETKAVYRGLKLLPIGSGISGFLTKMETRESFRE